VAGFGKRRQHRPIAQQRRRFSTWQEPDDLGAVDDPATGPATADGGDPPQQHPTWQAATVVDRTYFM
jgi:hypothetical protein